MKGPFFMNTIREVRKRKALMLEHQGFLLVA